jgi:hypothetical protein
MSKLRVLSFKPHLRLEWRGQDGQSETEQPDHSASLGDSITSSTRIRFSVHTAGTVVETNFGNVLILLLLDDSGIAQGASPETALDEEIMQLDQRGQLGARRADHHVGARGTIQHPRRQHDDHARCRVDVNNPAVGALLTVLASNTATIERMPAIMDFNFLPDMGRMNGRWRSGAKTICSRGLTAAASDEQSSAPSSPPQSSTTSSPLPGSETYCSA